MAVFSDREGSMVVSHEGRVVAKHSREERVMSDIYADVSYATVVNDDGSISSVYLKSHFECCPWTAYAVVDATPEVLALHAAYGARCSAENAVKVATALVAKLSKSAKPVAPVLPGFSRGDLVMVTGAVPGLTKGDLVTLDWAGRSKFSGADRVAVLVNGVRAYFPGTKVTRVASTDELAKADDAAMAATARNEAARVEALADEEAALANALAALPAVEAAYQAALSAMTPSAAVAA